MTFNLLTEVIVINYAMQFVYTLIVQLLVDAIVVIPVAMVIMSIVLYCWNYPSVIGETMNIPPAECVCQCTVLLWFVVSGL